MKKVLVLVISVALMLILCIDASASSNIYKVAELDLSIEFPSSYSVITRNISAYDPILDKLGVTKSELITHFQSNNIYLNAISDNSNEEVVVTMVEDYLFGDFNLFSDSNISTIATALINEYKNYGISASKYEVYQHSQAKFIKIYFTDAAQTVHGLQYYTIYGNKAMNFTMRSYTGTLSYTQEQTIKRIVDSIHFNTAPQKADVPNSTPAFTYTDTATKVKFTVPDNNESVIYSIIEEADKYSEPATEEEAFELIADIVGDVLASSTVSWSTQTTTMTAEYVNGKWNVTLPQDAATTLLDCAITFFQMLAS